jgi:hypothetical protein
VKHGARLAATGAVLAVAGTYLAAQVDYVRRHRPGVSPERYLVPQLTQIWLPGLALAATLAVITIVLRRRARS